DGQIFLESELFFSGFRPAVNVGLSVSRVGGSAQTKAIKSVAGRLRLDLAQYRELAGFAQFGSDLDKATRDRLAQGDRLMEVLKQGQYKPYSVGEQVIMLFAATNQLLLDVPTDKVNAFLLAFIDYLKLNASIVIKSIEESNVIDEAAEIIVRTGIEDFKQTWL
ncbi:MAG TPA: F0F1 ATP synthase subunit alpha, partial [Treponemataceae bacterium]|nr:F0F1 ATP synthase subunit alpha [Treponemataceae bacterium]